MLTILIIILILAAAICGSWYYRGYMANLLRRSKYGANLLGWMHSIIFDFKMEDPGEVPKQIAFAFIGLIVVIAIIAMIAARTSH